MNRRDLEQQVTGRTGRDGQVLLAAVLDAIMDAVAAGETVIFGNFGTFGQQARQVHFVPGTALLGAQALTPAQKQQIARRLKRGATLAASEFLQHALG